MARYFVKPIFWNTENYQKPSGARANSGFPRDHGYGHEEWNNSPALSFEEKHRRFRAFHTEGFGNAPLAESDGQIFVFMYASRDGIQQLVGVAGKATCLISNNRERQKLARKLKLHQLWKDAWSVERVRDCYGGDRASFMEFWRKSLDWIPNWKCPADLFFWPCEPITLDSRRITGKAKLLSMYGSYTEISPGAARRIMAMVPVAERTAAWSRLVEAIDTSPDDVETDLVDVKNDTNISETRRQALIEARLGQGRFRAELVKRWGGACAVSGCAQTQVLRASHIKPWRESTNAERLDSSNGLLLSANLDALFDKGLITFEDNGEMVVSSQIAPAERDRLGIPADLRKQPTPKERKFLAYHRSVLFVP